MYLCLFVEGQLNSPMEMRRKLSQLPIILMLRVAICYNCATLSFYSRPALGSSFSWIVPTGADSACRESPPQRRGGSSSAWIVPPRAVFRACARGRAQVGRSLRQRFAVRANAKEEAQVAGRDSKAELVGHCVEWRYEDYNQWCPYDAISSDVLERAYACGNTSVSLSLQTSSKIALRGVALYAVSFDKSSGFTQTNIATGHVRAVKRSLAGDFEPPGLAELEAPPFAPLAAKALLSGEEVMLHGRTFALREEVTLRADDVLSIRGPGTIVGDAHTIFKVMGRGQLRVSGVALVHAGAPIRRERRELGGAVLVLGKGSADLVNCSIHSQQGFGLWMKQRARVRANRCLFESCGRSAVVMFGESHLLLSNSTISDAGVHGICARGQAHVEMSRVHVSGCKTRGVFAYENATLELRSCSISGTRDPARAAVQVEALTAGDCATLYMDENCSFRSNVGVDVHVGGHVICSQAVEKVYGVTEGADGIRRDRKGTPTERPHAAVIQQTHQQTRRERLEEAY